MMSLPRIELLPRRVAVEVRPTEILWVDSVWRPSGPLLRGHGREAREEGESNEDFFARFSALHGLANAEVAVSIRHPDLAVSRLDLPPLPDRDAKRIAQRRAQQLADQSLEAAISGFVLAPGKRPRPAWLVACPEEFASFALDRWRKQGLPVSQISSMHLALGTLTRAMQPPESGQLRAILDIGTDHAICVLADAEGWLFSREVSIRLTHLGNAVEDESNPIERLASELRRTFHYIAVELRLGSVSELLLSGARDSLPDLAGNIEALLDLPVSLVGDAITEGPAADIDAAFGALVGISLMPRLGGANLLPVAARRTLAKNRVQRHLVAASVFSGVVLVAGAAHFVWSQSNLETRWAALEERWSVEAGDRAESEARWEGRRLAEQVISAVEILSPSQSAWSWALQTLGPMLPDDAFIAKLTGVRVDGEWSAELEIEFRGVDLATAAEAGSQFASELNASPLWTVESVAQGSPSRGRSSAVFDDSAVRAQFRIESRVAPIRTARRIEDRDPNLGVSEEVDNG